MPVAVLLASSGVMRRILSGCPSGRPGLISSHSYLNSPPPGPDEAPVIVNLAACPLHGLSAVTVPRTGPGLTVTLAFCEDAIGHPPVSIVTQKKTLYFFSPKT